MPIDAKPIRHTAAPPVTIATAKDKVGLAEALQGALLRLYADGT